MYLRESKTYRRVRR